MNTTHLLKTNKSNLSKRLRDLILQELVEDGKSYINGVEIVIKKTHYEVTVESECKRFPLTCIGFYEMCGFVGL